MKGNASCVTSCKKPEKRVANPLPQDPPPLDEKPEEAVRRVLELIRRLNDRLEVMRRLEEQDEASRAAFEKSVQPEIDALDQLRASYETAPPTAADMDRLDAAIEQRSKNAALKRATHSAIIGMVRDVVPVAAAATGHSEQWLTGALGYVARPSEREAQHALDMHFELEALAAEVDPDGGPAGDVVEDPADVPAWMRRALGG